MKKDQKILLNTCKEAISQIKSLALDRPDILIRVRIIEEVLQSSILIANAINEGDAEQVEREIKDLHEKIAQIVRPSLKFKSGGIIYPEQT